jgi:hypothetical protein
LARASQCSERQTSNRNRGGCWEALYERDTRTSRWTVRELVASRKSTPPCFAARRERFLKHRAGIAARKDFYGEGKIRSQ